MHTQTQSSSPWKTMIVLLGNTGERKCSGLWSPQSPILPINPCPVPAFCPDLLSLSLWLGWSSALPPSSQPFQLTNNWSRITNNRNSKQQQEVPLIWTSTIVKHNNFFSGFADVLDATCVGLFCVCAWCDIVVSFEKKDSSGSRNLGVWV